MGLFRPMSFLKRLGGGMGSSGGGLTPVSDGLLAEYRYDDGSGQVLTDYSGNGYHMQLGATAGVEASDPTWAATGQTLDGGDWNTLPSAPAAMKPDAWTVMTLFKITAGSYCPAIGWSIGATNPGFFNTYASSEKPLFYLGSGNLRYATPASAMDTGTWWVVTATCPGAGQNDVDNVTCYQNKTLLSLESVTKSTAQAAKADPNIGRAATRYLTGGLGFTLLYNRALAEAEIFQNYEYIKGAVAGRGITLP